MKKYLLPLLILLISSSIVFAQGNYKSNKKLYQTGLRHFSAEDYAKALSIFLKLDDEPIEQLIEDPHENKYVVDEEAVPEIKILTKYHIGLCYLYLKSEKNKAIPYFEHVIKSKYQRVPDLIHIQLGMLYYQNYKFDKALSSFKNYLQLYDQKDILTASKQNENLALAQNMTVICEKAKMLYNDSTRIIVINAGTPINSGNSQYNPYIAADDSKIVFNRSIMTTAGVSASKKDSVIQILTSQKTEGKWQTPTPVIIYPNPADANPMIAGLSGDGQQLYLRIKDNDSYNLYSCLLDNEKCDDLTRLPLPVNSEYNEGKISITPDGTEIYFSSDRPGGYGGMDIYKTTKNENGDWTKPINLGPAINSTNDEDAPYIHADKKTLYFSSKGNGTMGSYDLFKSVYIGNGEWSIPSNIGYPVNTINEETDISVTASGEKGYFSKTDKLHIKNIYSFLLNQNIPLTLVKGTILAGDPLKPVAARIKVIDKQTNTRVKYIYNPNPKTGKYLMIFPPGKDYDIIVESKDYLPQLINIHIPNQTYFYELFQEIHLKPLNLMDKKLGEEVSVTHTFFDIYQTTSDKQVISKSGAKDYGKLLSLIERLIFTTDSLGLEKIDKAFDNIFLNEEKHKDSIYKKDLGRLIDFIDMAIETTDTTTLGLLDKNTLYKKDYTHKYFYSEEKPIDLHKVIIGKDTIYTTPPLKANGNETDRMAGEKPTVKEKKKDVNNIKPHEKKIILTYSIYFTTGKADIDNKYYSEMREIVKLLKMNPELYLEIYGYCDSRGGVEENYQLSEKRAKRVLKYFNEIGINTETATVRGYGKTFSEKEKTDADRQQNRRVDVKIFEYIRR